MRPQIRVGAVVALAAVVAFGVWLAVRHDGHNGTAAATTATTAARGATAVSPEELKALAERLGRPIYWAGTEDGVTYEVTHTPDGRIYVRYLPKGVEIGAQTPYLTIGTYPVKGAFAVTKGVADRSGSVKIRVGGGGIAFYSTDRPTSVYEAFPGSDFQVEVYDPSASRAHGLVSGGSIEALNASAPTATSTAPTTTAAASQNPGAVAATPATLKAVATTLGRPVYWLGAKSGVTYELTQTPDGRVYVRYLPKGVEIGSNRVYLTVGTYPLTNAYATTSSAADQPGATKIPVDGGVAFSTKARPTSAYLAFKGVDEQIEVFDPNAAELHKLVASGEVRPVS